MKAPDWNDELLAEHRAHLRSEDRRLAFDALVTLGVRLQRYDFRPCRQGEVRTLALDAVESGERILVCVVNQGDLLCIVRKSGRDRVPGGLRNLKDSFGWAYENSAGEWRIRLRTAEEARQLGRLLFGDELQERAVAANAEARSGFWWVNHRQSFRQEFAGGYLWSPKCNRNGSVNESYGNMTRVQRGDIVFSCAGGELRAAGIVLAGASEAPRPGEHSVADDAGVGEEGWLVPVRLQLLDQPLKIKAHAAELATVLPERYSPIRASGEGNPGVYLAQVPAVMATALMRLLAGQVERIQADIAPQAAAQWADGAAEVKIGQRRDIAPALRVQLIKARHGLGVYRQNVEQVEHACRVTKVLDRRHLRAAHIKPWRSCDDREKLDGCNGLLLAPHVQHLFERGYISFADNGDLLTSRMLNLSVLAAWGVALPFNAGAFRPEQQAYLAHHRSEVFEQHDGGRRS
jgi:putative restriction endonuclease